MDKSDSRHESARFSLILHSTQLAHIASIGAIKTIEPGEGDIDLDTLRPSVSAKEFLDLFIFFNFCIGMLGRLRAEPARNYVLDSLDLFIGAGISQLRGHEVANGFERLRMSRLTRYMNQMNNFGSVKPTPSLGRVVDLLCTDFEVEVMQRRLPALQTVVREMLAAEMLATEHERPDFKDDLKIDLGRNTDQLSIAEFLKTLRAIKSVHQRADTSHIDQTLDIFDVYLGKGTVWP